MEWRFVWGPIAAFLLVPVFQFAMRRWFRCPLSVAYQTAILFGLIVLAVLLMSGSNAISSSSMWLVLLAVLTYINACYTFFHLNNMGETARRVRLVTEILEAGGRMDLEQLRQRYSSEEAIELRLVRLAAMGQITRWDGMIYQAGGAMRISALIVQFVKRLVLPRH